MKNSADQGGCYPQRQKAEVDNTPLLTSLTQYGEDSFQIWWTAAGYGELCVWFKPIKNGKIFWMNNNSNSPAFTPSYATEIGKYSILLAKFKIDFLSNQQEYRKASHTFVVHHLLIDTERFVWPVCDNTKSGNSV